MSAGKHTPDPRRTPCPTCEGCGKVVSLRFGRERVRQCPTCGGHGVIDAGVWPYEPWTSAYREEQRTPSNATGGTA